MRFAIITLFPDAVRPYLDASVLGKAQKEKRITVRYYDPRDFTKDRHAQVDERPFGGGPGMVLKPGPVYRAVRRAFRDINRKKHPGNTKVILLSAHGTAFTQEYARTLAHDYENVIMIAGHYEGVDARIKDIFDAEEVSIGPYILSGGELPAMVIADAVSRHVPGVLGNEQSQEEQRIASPEVYTRPRTFRAEGKDWEVPEVLTSGDHKEIDAWKEARRKEREDEDNI